MNIKRMMVVCCSSPNGRAPSNNGVEAAKLVKLEQIRMKRHMNAKQLHTTLVKLSEMTKTSTASRNVHSKVIYAIEDISLLSQAIYINDVNIELHLLKEK